MASTGAGYDDSCATYSPDGRVYQVEYAQKAIEMSGTCVGVRCKDGIVLAVEKILSSKMLVATSNRKIFHIDDHIGVAVSGWAADGRQLVNRAIDECHSYRSNFGHEMSPAVLNDHMGGFLHAYTCYYHLRPFGASMIIAGYDEMKKEPQLCMAQHNGEAYRYFGCALGKGARAAKTEIEKHKFMEKTCVEALPLLAKTLLITHEESQEKPYKLEMSWVTEDTEWKHKRVSEEQILAAQEWAKQSIEEDDESSDDDSSDDDDDDDDMEKDA